MTLQRLFLIVMGILLMFKALPRSSVRRLRPLCSRSCSSSSSNGLVGYTTDLEGDYSYWKHYIANSKILYRDKNSSHLKLREGSYFVFGGDVCDRGPGDIQLLEDLLQLKNDFPARISFILGNRDINKLRLPFSLHPNVLARAEPMCYWLRNQHDHDQAHKEVQRNRSSKLKWVSVLDHVIDAVVC